MKYRLTKFPLIYLLLLISFFCQKKFFYSKNIQYAYNFYGTGLNVYRGVFRTHLTIYGGASFINHKKALLQVLDWVLNTSLVQILQNKRLIEVTIYLIQSTSNICHCAFVSPVNKTHFGLKRRCNLFLAFLLLLTS